jgi:hypothetical protein
MKQLKFVRSLALMMLSVLPSNAMWASGPLAGAADNEKNAVSNEALFNGYVEQMINESLPVSKRKSVARFRSAKAGLTGNDLRLYVIFKEAISEIAAGDRQSTAIEVSPAELCGETCTWTAAQLGVENINSQDAFNAAFAKVQYNGGKVLSALLADCPYELYWFDKTIGWSTEPYGASTDGTVITIPGPIIFKLAVAKEYSSTDAQGTYEMKPKTDLAITTVKAAITRAANIVELHKSESLFNRLASYKDEICGMTDYNSAAAEDDTTPYGNPWQLIWVFDNDPNTTVVCEGYSKAFKYLCDLSNFSNVECLLVKGQMADGFGSGGHMWNVMKMDDGKNYHVDVTNCDEGTIGYPDRLFMAYGPTGYYPDWFRFLGSIDYGYDNETWTTFDESALTISSTPYVANMKLDEDGDLAAQLGALTGRMANITYSRKNLTPAKPLTVCLPWNYQKKASDGKFYTFTGVSKDGSVWTATMTEHSGATLTANAPYLYVPESATVDFSGEYQVAATLIAGSSKSEDNEWSFQGVYEQKSWSAAGNDYGFAAKDGVAADGKSAVSAGDFVRAGNGAFIKSMRCYLTYNTSSSRTRTIGEDLPDRITVILKDNAGNTTRIGEIDIKGGNEELWFDMNGRQLNGKPSGKGVFINQGRKIVIK